MNHHLRRMSEPTDIFQYCRNIVNRDDRDRYLATIFAASPVHNQLWALWAFNQEVAKIRENVSEAMLGEIRLQWWSDALEELMHNCVREHPVCQALAHAELGPDIFALLLETISARKLDMFDNGPADFAALTAYADGVGGALQEAAYRISVANHPDKMAIAAARRLGRAWAMLGLVRALPFHWQTGRNYMPESVREGMMMPEPEKAFLMLQPTIERMLNSVATELEEVQAFLKGAKKTHKTTFTPVVLIRLYLKALRKAGNNPFETPLHDVSELKKLLHLLFFKIAS